MTAKEMAAREETLEKVLDAIYTLWEGHSLNKAREENLDLCIKLLYATIPAECHEKVEEVVDELLGTVYANLYATARFVLKMAWTLPQ